MCQGKLAQSPMFVTTPTVLLGFQTVHFVYLLLVARELIAAVSASYESYIPKKEL